MKKAQEAVWLSVEVLRKKVKMFRFGSIEKLRRRILRILSNESSGKIRSKGRCFKEFWISASRSQYQILLLWALDSVCIIALRGEYTTLSCFSPPWSTPIYFLATTFWCPPFQCFQSHFVLIHYTMFVCLFTM